MTLQRRSRVSRKPARPVRRFVLGNVLPLGIVITLGVLWYRGVIDFEEILPPGADENLVALIVCIALLFVVASISLPAAHAVVKAADASFQRRASVLGGGGRRDRSVDVPESDGEEDDATDGGDSKLGALFTTPVFAAIYVIAWPIRFVLMLASFALLAVSIVFTVRLFDPDFLQAWVDRFL